MKPFENGSAELEMFKQFYAICKRFWNPVDDDRYWEEYRITINQFHKVYPPLSRDLGRALSNYLEYKFSTKEV